MAKNNQQKQIAYRIRWKVFADEGYFSKDFVQKRWTDEYDKHSIIFLVMYKNEPIGTLRLIEDIETGMALNDFFNIKIDKNIYEGDIIEIGRFVIIKKYRAQSRLATLALILMAHRYSIKNNIGWWTGCASEALLKSFNGFVKHEKLTQYPLSHAQENLRKEYEGYFVHRVIPFMIKVDEISPYRGLWIMKNKFLKGYSQSKRTVLRK